MDDQGEPFNFTISFEPDWHDGLPYDLKVRKNPHPSLRDLNKWADDFQGFHVALCTNPKEPDSEVKSEAQFVQWLASAAAKVLYVNNLGKSTMYAPKKLLPKEIELKRAMRGPGKGSKKFFEEIYGKFADRVKQNQSSEMNQAEFRDLMVELFQKHQWKTEDLDGTQRVMNADDANKLFDAFDEDKSGSIDFQEVILGLSTLMDGDEEDKLAYAFAAFDTDGNGQMDIQELTRMLVSVNGFDSGTAVTQANQIMQAFDKDDGAGGAADQQLSLAEFKKWVASLFVGLTD